MKEEIVYKKDDPLNKNIYFLKSGSIALYSKVRYRSRIDVDECDKLKKDQQGELKWIFVCTLTEGAIFGDEELTDQTKRAFTAKCHSLTAEIYKITKPDLEKRLWW